MVSLPEITQRHQDDMSSHIRCNTIDSRRTISSSDWSSTSMFVERQQVCVSPYIFVVAHTKCRFIHVHLEAWQCVACSCKLPASNCLTCWVAPDAHSDRTSIHSNAWRAHIIRICRAPPKAAVVCASDNTIFLIYLYKIVLFFFVVLSTIHRMRYMQLLLSARTPDTIRCVCSSIISSYSTVYVSSDSIEIIDNFLLFLYFPSSFLFVFFSGNKFSSPYKRRKVHFHLTFRT